VTVIAQNVTIR